MEFSGQFVQQGIRLHPIEISILNSKLDEEKENKMNYKVIINTPISNHEVPELRELV